jgi:hypothetical protein
MSIGYLVSCVSIKFHPKILQYVSCTKNKREFLLAQLRQNAHLVGRAISHNLCCTARKGASARAMGTS